MGIQRQGAFINRLRLCESIEAVRAQVDVEYDYLADSYNTLSSLKKGFTDYRNYIKGHSFTGSKISGVEITQEVLRRFILTEAELEELAQQHKKQIVSDMSNLREIRYVYEHIDLSVNLLRSRTYIEQIIGLAALTGRRVAEIATSAEFKFISPRRILFSGQLKTRDREGVTSYEIPVLCDSAIVIEGLKRLRFERPYLINQARLFHDRCSKDLNKKTSQLYRQLYKEELKPKDLRSIYAEICYKLHNTNPLVSRALYYAQVLGHAELDVVTAQSYDDFRINDPKIE